MRVAADDRTDAMHDLTGGFECRGEFIGAPGVHDNAHADAAVEGAEEFVRRQPAGVAQPGKDRGQGPLARVDIGTKPRRQDPGQVLNQAATRDMSQRLDAPGLDRREQALDIDARRRQQLPGEYLAGKRCFILYIYTRFLNNFPNQGKAV